jgi:hypothetical protein
VLLEPDHYLFQLRQACLQQPALNRHQLAALSHLRAIEAQSTNIDAFLASTKNLLCLARAESLDRAFNLHQVALSLDDPWLATATAIEFRHALQGNSHPDFHAALLGAKRASAPFHQLSVEIRTSIERLFLALLRQETWAPDDPANLAQMKQSFEALLRADSAFRPQTWLTQPRYSLRLPWAPNLPSTWLQPLWPASLPPQSPFPVPSIDVHSREWLAKLLHYEGDWPTPPPLPLAPVQTMADQILAHQLLWPDPVLAQHAQQTCDLLSAASSPIAREAIAEDRALQFEITALANRLQLSAWLAPFTAPHPHREAAIATARALSGLEPAAILALPRIQNFLNNNLNRWLHASEEFQGSLQGDAGLELLQQALANLRS